MKKLFAIIFISLLLSIVSNGQPALYKKQPSKEITSYVRTIDQDIPTPAYRNEINVKAVRHFLRHFDNVSNDEWYDAPDRSVVTFNSNGVRYRVDYDKQGGWIQTIRTYDATKLPSDVREAVRISYYDFNIFQVQEVEMPLHPVNYFIHLEGKTKLINLRIYNGEIEELQKFDKSN
jgi:hypothetical protein